MSESINLHEAAYTDDAEAVREYIAQGVDLNEALETNHGRKELFDRRRFLRG